MSKSCQILGHNVLAAPWPCLECACVCWVPLLTPAVSGDMGGIPPSSPALAGAKQRGHLAPRLVGWDELFTTEAPPAFFFLLPCWGNNPRIDHRLYEFFTQKISEWLLHELGLQFNTSTDKKWSLHNDWRSTTPGCPYPTVRNVDQLFTLPCASTSTPTKRCCKNQKS